jgi:hypothetical protein
LKRSTSRFLRNIGYPDFDFEAADDDSFARVYSAVEDAMLDLATARMMEGDLPQKGPGAGPGVDA